VSGYVFEAILVGQVEHQYDGVAASVVGGGDRSEPFLACSVPDLQLDLFLIDRDLFYCKVYTDRSNIGIFESVSGHLTQYL